MHKSRPSKVDEDIVAQRIFERREGVVPVGSKGAVTEGIGRPGDARIVMLY